MSRAALPLMTPRPAPDGAAMTAWLEAQGSFAADLAQFQATAPACSSYEMADVLQAIAPAQQLGFAYSIQWLPEAVQVRLMHRSGWDMNAVLPPDETAWKALADLLGVPVGVACSAAAVQPKQAPAPVAVCAAPAAPAAEPDEFGDADLMGDGTPDTPVLPEDREPLSEADRETCLSMIRALTQEQRRQFTIAFRSHFNVDKSQRAIAPHIVQVQHQKFIQAYIDELELSEVAA